MATQDIPANETSEQLEARLAQERLDERRRLGLSPDAPEHLVIATRNELEKDDDDAPQKEATVLQWLLGATVPLEFDCKTHVDTEHGRQDLIFHFRQIDDTKLDEIEKAHTTQTILGREVDRPMLNASIVAEALLYFEDAEGNQVDPKSAEFCGPMPPSDALRGRFKFQPGVIIMVAEEVRAAAGLGGDRVEEARRAEGKEPGQSAAKSITEAVGN